MKPTFYIIISILLLSCNQKVLKNIDYRTNFNKEELEILKTADSIIKSAYYATLITLDKHQQPRARIIEPFAPKDHYVIWIGTNPKSRKVNQLKNNSKTTLHYFDKNKLA
ncbi:pyridoxamine 5'-phosphate oxidase family protein, partial [Lutibacter sp.]